MTIRGLACQVCVALVCMTAGSLAGHAGYAYPRMVLTEQQDAMVTAAELRALRQEFSDVTDSVEQQGRELGMLAANDRGWLDGLTGIDPGSGRPWDEVVTRQLSEGREDVRLMQAQSKDIGDLISRALSALRHDDGSSAFRMTQSVAALVNRLTDDAANSGKNITLTLGVAQPILEKVGNGGGLQKIAAAVQLQSSLMRNLRQTENVIPSNAFKDVIPGEVEPAEIKAARQEFRQVTSSLNQQLADLEYLLSGKSDWKHGSEATDPGTGQPWGLILGQKVETSRADVQRLDLQADVIAASLSRAFRSARQENEGGIRLAVRSATQDLQQLTRDAQGAGNNLAMTLTSTRPLLERVGDQAGLQKIARSLQLQSDLLNRLQQSQRRLAESLPR